MLFFDFPFQISLCVWIDLIFIRFFFLLFYFLILRMEDFHIFCSNLLSVSSNTFHEKPFTNQRLIDAFLHRSFCCFCRCEIKDEMNFDDYAVKNCLDFMTAENFVYMSWLFLSGFLPAVACLGKRFVIFSNFGRSEISNVIYPFAEKCRSELLSAKVVELVRILFERHFELRLTELTHLELCLISVACLRQLSKTSLFFPHLWLMI